MTDDIVTRIREQANAGYIDEHEVMLRMAADEIERLRQSLTIWRELAYLMFNKCRFFMPRAVLREFDRAHYSEWTFERKRELKGLQQ